MLLFLLLLVPLYLSHRQKTNKLACYKSLVIFFALFPSFMTFLDIDSLVTELTPYSRVLHKLYCRQLLKNFLTLTAIMFHYLFHNRLPVSQNPVHILPYYFLGSILILFSVPGPVYHVRGFIILGFF